MTMPLPALTRRVLLMSAILAVAVAAPATPVSAGGPRTLVVDDDGQASAASCSSTRSAYRRIQRAINLSAAFDTILVCPGTYTGQLVVSGYGHRGLKIKAVRAGRAVVKGPAALTGAEETDAIVTVSSNRVLLQGLKVLAPTGGSCEETEFVIWITTAKNVVVSRNRVAPTGTGDAKLGPCGYRVGIRVGEGASAEVLDNFVTNFKSLGIQGHGVGTVATIRRNQVRFWHPLAAGTASRQGVTPALPAETMGIRMYQSTGPVSGNQVSSTSGADSESEQVNVGISVYGATPNVRYNTVRRASRGIILQGAATPTASGTVRGNDLAAGLYMGMQLDDADDNLVDANLVTGFSGQGIIVLSNSSGNTVSGNDFRGNGSTDCVDQSVGPANTWSGNLGDESDPASICAPEA